MKKIIAIVLGIIMIASIFMFTSCEKDEDTTTIISPNDESTVSVDDSTEVTPVSSEEVTESDTDIEVDPPVDSETDTSAVG